jgi:hypothetical protein
MTDERSRVSDPTMTDIIGLLTRLRSPEYFLGVCP